MVQPGAAKHTSGHFAECDCNIMKWTVLGLEVTYVTPCLAGFKFMMGSLSTGDTVDILCWLPAVLCKPCE